MLGGDGIGPSISDETQKAVEHLLRDVVRSGKVNFGVIEGVTIENRAAFGEYIMSTVEDPIVEARWDEYVKGE